MWHNTDIYIKITPRFKNENNSNGEDLTWITPFQSSKEPLVSKHLTHSLYPFFENCPKNTLKKIIKINLLGRQEYLKVIK